MFDPIDYDWPLRKQFTEEERKNLKKFWNELKKITSKYPPINLIHDFTEVLVSEKDAKKIEKRINFVVNHSRKNFNVIGEKFVFPLCVEGKGPTWEELLKL